MGGNLFYEDAEFDAAKAYLSGAAVSDTQGEGVTERSQGTQTPQAQAQPETQITPAESTELKLPMPKVRCQS